jgi:hypothetical protein
VLGGRVRVSFYERQPMTFLASEVRPVTADQGGQITPTPTPVPVDTPPSDSDDNLPDGNGGNGSDDTGSRG